MADEYGTGSRIGNRRNATGALNSATANDAYLEDQLGDVSDRLGGENQNSGYAGTEFNTYYNYTQPSDKNRRRRAENQDFQRQVDSWNSRMDAAYEAANSGDMDLANKLKSEVDSEVNQWHSTRGTGAYDQAQSDFEAAQAGRADALAAADAEAERLGLKGEEREKYMADAKRSIRQEWNPKIAEAERRRGESAKDVGFQTTTRDRNAGARAAQSPMSQIMGGLIRDARELQDPNSAGSERFKDALTAGAVVSHCKTSRTGRTGS